MSLLQIINELGPDKTELLYSRVIDGQELTVRQYENYRWLSADGEMIQSLIDLENPATLLLPNLVAMLALLELVDSPVSLLNLGAGCGAIERYFTKYNPEIHLTSIEPNDRILKLAQEYFGMSPEDVIQDSAEHFLANNTDHFDIIMVDIYSEEKQPQCLYEAEFHRDLCTAVAEKGGIAMNLLPHTEEELLRILRPLNEHIDCILLHLVPNHDNVIIYALNNGRVTQDELANRLEKINQQGLELQVIASN